MTALSWFRNIFRKPELNSVDIDQLANCREDRMKVSVLAHKSYALMEKERVTLSFSYK